MSDPKDEHLPRPQSLDRGVVNASIPGDYYTQHPCLIGYSYIRFTVSGDILPCCVAKHDIGNSHTQDWRDVWHSGGYENFRRKQLRIHKEHFHLVDPEWTFCQQCSHLPLNQRSNQLLSEDRPKRGA